MSKDVAKVLPHDIEAIFQFAIEGLIKGYSEDVLVEKIQGDWMNVPEDEIKKQIRRAIKAIREETLTDIDKIIPQHIEQYEQIYQEADALRNVTLKLKAMKAKEKLVGLHREVNSVEIHNEVNVEVELEPQYDLSKLDLKEQKRLQALLIKIER